MANKDISFLWDVDKTLRLFPDRRYGLSLSTWGTNAKTADQEAAPNKGSYESTIDDTYRYYVLFEGASQPSNWSNWLAVIDILLNATPQTSSPIILPPPEDDDLSGGYGYTYDENEEIVGDVEVNFQLIRGPGTEALILSTAVRTITSNEDGELTGYFRKGATYRAWTDEIQQHVVFEVPNTDTFALPEIIRW